MSVVRHLVRKTERKMLLNVKHQNKFWSSLSFCTFSLNLFELRFPLLCLCFLRSYICFILLFYNISCQWAMFPVAHNSLRAARYGSVGRKPPRLRFKKSGTRLWRKTLQKTSWLSSFQLRPAKNIATSVNNWRGSRGSQAREPSWDKEELSHLQTGSAVQNGNAKARPRWEDMQHHWGRSDQHVYILERRKLCTTLPTLVPGGSFMLD